MKTILMIFLFVTSTCILAEEVELSEYTKTTLDRAKECGYHIGMRNECQIVDPVFEDACASMLADRVMQGPNSALLSEGVKIGIAVGWALGVKQVQDDNNYCKIIKQVIAQRKPNKPQ